MGNRISGSSIPSRLGALQSRYKGMVPIVLTVAIATLGWYESMRLEAQYMAHAPLLTMLADRWVSALICYLWSITVIGLIIGYIFYRIENNE